MNFPATQIFRRSRATLLSRGLLGAVCVGLPGLAGAQLQLSLRLQPLPTVTIAGPTGTVCQVQWGDDLAERGRWFHLAHRTLTNGTTVADTNPSPFGPRFYRAVQVPNTNMVLIPGGTFVMGDSFTDGPASERPTRALTLSGFYFDQCEVSKVLWDAVSQWALTNGYSFDNVGAGKATTHPVQTVSWYDVVKWCNARSEREGRTPAYYTSASQTTVYRGGQLNLTNDCVNWSVNGYRLPTEAEWECAARGGADGLRFPRGNTISHAGGNFFAATYLSYDTTGSTGFHPDFSADAPPYTSPCGWFPANAYGLFDLTGNVWEWCWDSYDSAWYANPAAMQTNTRGPAGFGGERVLRGGSWLNDASFARNASRIYATYSSPAAAADVLGFRSAITAPTISGQPVAPARLTEMARLPGGALRFTISNLTPGRINVVAVSTNLQQWMPVWTNVPVAAAVAFTNTSPAAANQFFRTWQVP